MKKLLCLSFVMLVCACNNHAPASQTDRATAFACDQDFTTCMNRCHHVGGSNADEADCVQSCRDTQKKCGK